MCSNSVGSEAGRTGKMGEWRHGISMDRCGYDPVAKRRLDSPFGTAFSGLLSDEGSSLDIMGRRDEGILCSLFFSRS